MRERLFWIKKDGRIEELDGSFCSFRMVIKKKGLIFRVYNGKIAFYQGRNVNEPKWRDREMVFLNKKQAKSLIKLINKLKRGWK